MLLLLVLLISFKTLLMDIVSLRVGLKNGRVATGADPFILFDCICISEPGRPVTCSLMLPAGTPGSPDKKQEVHVS
jgi:hypothetical protein